MSGIKKKWTKVTNKEKRDWATVLSAEVAEEIEKNVPKSKLITPGKLAERYKISVTVARKVLRQLVADGKLEVKVNSHTMKAYGRPAGAPEPLEEEKEEAPQKKPAKGGQKK